MHNLRLEHGLRLTCCHLWFTAQANSLRKYLWFFMPAAWAFLFVSFFQVLVGQEAKSSKTTSSFEQFQSKWEATESSRVHANFRLAESDVDGNFVVDIGNRITGSSVPIKVSLTNGLAYPVSAKAKASCGCAAGVPDKFEIDSNQSRDFLLLYKVPSTLGEASASIYCFDSKVRTRFAIHITGRAIADFEISKSVIELESDSDVVINLSASPTQEGQELGDFSIRSSPVANFVTVVGTNRNENGSASIDIKVGKSEGSFLQYQFELVHIPSQIGVPMFIRYVNRIQSFPRAAVFRDRDGEFSCRLLLKGPKARDFVEHAESCFVVLAKPGATNPCTAEFQVDGQAIYCTLKSDVSGFLKDREKATLQFCIKGETVFSVPCFWME